MKYLSLVLIIGLTGFIMGIDGCQTTSNFYYDSNGQYVEITDPPGQCVLYKILGDTTVYKTGLFVANYAAIKAKIYTAEDAITQLDVIEKEVLRPGASVGSVINTLFIVSAKASKAGAPEIILITEGLSPYKGNMTPLDECTVYKLVAYIGSQRNLCLAFQNS
ncbi:MAG: hypothetical protein AM326_01810 [Candidatus Thorarchaeota archaeon SMTZ-45]|nr:MAG: hypothetical protein AM326_01810 [Candidatus Thorarchaeota archaeon SMTZ-45]